MSEVPLYLGELNKDVKVRTEGDEGPRRRRNT